MRNGVLVEEPRSVLSMRRWQEIDWAMKALSLAMYHCGRLQMPDVVAALESAHSVLQARRDRA